MRSLPGEARHYDLWRLLGTDESPAIPYLQEHRDVELLLDDYVQITQRFHGSSPERPEGGFASSVSFAPEVVVVVEKAYAKICGALVFSGSDGAGLQVVVDRIRTHASHLKFSLNFGRDAPNVALADGTSTSKVSNIERSIYHDTAFTGVDPETGHRLKFEH